MKKLLLGLFVFCLLFTGTAVHAGWVSDAVLKEILQFRASLGGSAYNAYPSSYTNTITTKTASTVVVAPVPTVLTPNGGEVIKTGSTYPITWKAPVGVSSVNIYIDTGVRCVVAPCPSSVVIASGVKNTGSYNWYVDPNVSYGGGSGLKIVISNGNYSDSSDATFSIAAATAVCPTEPSLAQCPTGTTSSLIYDTNKCVIGHTACTPVVVAKCTNGATNPPECTTSTTCPVTPSLAQCPTGTTSSLIYDANKCVTGQTCSTIATDELACCGSFGYGSQMIKTYSSYSMIPKSQCVTPAAINGGGKEIVANSFCEAKIACPVPPSLAQCPAGTTSQLTYDTNKCVTGQNCVANPTPIPTVTCPVGLISKDSCDSINGTFKTTVDSNGCTSSRCVPSTTGVITRTLKMGMRGKDVKILQNYLGVRADGYFGRGTKIKVIQWQKANGLTADGIFGPSCILKSGLGLVTPSPTPTPTPSPTPVPTPLCTNGATNYPTCTSELKIYSNVSNPIAQNISTSATNPTSGIIGLIFNIKNTSNIDVVIKTISATLGNNNPNISGYYLSDGSIVIASLGNPNSTIVTFTNLPSTLVVPANSIKTLNIKMDVSATATPGYQSISVAASDIAAIDSNSNSLSSSLTGIASGLKQTFQATDVVVKPTCLNGATNYPTCTITPVCPPAPSLAQCPANTTSQLTYDANKCVTGQTCNPVAVTLACGSGGSCTAADIAPHNTRANCWVYMSGTFTTKFTANKAYNITSYVANGSTHPGGDVIVSHCGGNLYDYVVGSSGGHAHSSNAINTILQSYYIGPML